MENDYDNIILGGKEIVVKGWGEYEINKRYLRSKIRGDRYKKYYSTKYIYPQDILDSVLGGNVHNSSYNIIYKLAIIGDS